ncbi:MAG: MgtC/SapB family protein [Pseudobutyrivibrio sp.]|nr:MgtC/SapB family protein [Pseudobutyrivibrio sp.]
MINVVFSGNFEIEVIIRMICALISGFALGFERSKQGKAAGIRTYMLVAIGACIFAIASKYGFSDFVGDGRRADVSRVAANIVTGVSFLGAGTITFRSDRVVGVTTAAGIWVMAAVGTAYGCGMYVIAIVATIYMVIVQGIFHDSMTRRLHVKVPGRVDVTMDTSIKSLNKVLDIFDEFQMEVDSTGIERHKGDSLLYSFNVNVPESVSTIEVVNALSAIKNVQSVDM